MNPFSEKNIIVGITGSIAAYKAAEIASALTKAGANVQPVLTPAGEKFITPLTLQSVTGNHASVDNDLWTGEHHVAHITLGHNADLIMITPASANFMAKVASGLGDSLLALTILASHCPVLIAPAMDGDMYANAATQANVALLRERGFYFVGPAQGHLASGLTGVGRMTEPTEIIAATRYILSRNNSLKGKKIIVTAGGTREAIDPVRYIGNRSSGKQGLALAQAAQDSGADVILIKTPALKEKLYGAENIEVVSAEEMRNAVFSNLPDADGLLMVAAVADYKPQITAEEKIKKTGIDMTLQLEPTTDILREIGENRNRYPKLKALGGFAAESEELLNNAKTKLKKKHLDFIFANDISSSESGFESDQNKGFLIDRSGKMREVPLLSKQKIAEEIVTELVKLFTE